MILILKGLLIGIGKIIPGVSGSIIAINLGVYEKAISCITNFFSNVKYNIKYLTLLGIGIIISINVFSSLICYLLNNYYVITMFIFIGFILSTKHYKRINKYNYITLITFIIVILLGLLSFNNEIIIVNPILNFFYYFFIGFIDALTMIVPGISGTALLMMLGVYNFLLEIYSNIFNIPLIISNISIIIPFFIGIIIGFFLISKAINYCFTYYNTQTYKAIDGFLYGTIFYMFINIFKRFNNIWEIIIGLLLCVIIIIGRYNISN